jgi:hypothetical protein
MSFNPPSTISEADTALLNNATPNLSSHLPRETEKINYILNIT